MTAETTPDVIPATDVVWAAAEYAEGDRRFRTGATYWQVTERSESGHPIRLVQMTDVMEVKGADGEVIGYSVGFHPSRGLMHPMDLVVRPAEPEPAVTPHHCAMLADLDCYAAAGDSRAAALARWHEQHPDGPQTPSEHIEEQAIRAGFMKRSTER